jgi:hypothetical protein
MSTKFGKNILFTNKQKLHTINEYIAFVDESYFIDIVDIIIGIIKTSRYLWPDF